MKTKNPHEMIETLKLEQERHYRRQKKRERKHRKKYFDHFHGNQHYDRYGNMDRITKAEFGMQSYFKFTKRNLTFKITASGVILALSVTVSALDILFESFLMIPVGQVYVSFRFLDTIILLLGLPILGPIFGSLVGFLEPIFHNLIHGFEHGWIQPLTDSLTNVLIMWLTWLIYYIAFRNSSFHRDPNKHCDRFKRYTPSAILTVLVGTIATATFILALYIQHETGVSPHNLAHEHDHGSEISWDALIHGNAGIIVLSLWGLNLLRYFIGYGLFSVLEVKLRPLNHRYR